MNMTSDFKRRIHIEGQPDNPTGHLVTIRDADTGEAITGIKSMVISMDASQVNKAEITYYEINERGNVVADENREPVTHTATVEGEDVSLNITAFETVPTTEVTTDGSKTL